MAICPFSPGGEWDDGDDDDDSFKFFLVLINNFSTLLTF